MDTSFPGDGDVHKQQKNCFDSGQCKPVRSTYIIWRISPQNKSFRKTDLDYLSAFKLSRKIMFYFYCYAV